MIRFLVKPLDPAYYAQCVEVLSTLEEGQKVSTDPEEFLSLFALGVNAHTQRHKDRNDTTGGLAGLCTMGWYTGK